MNILVVAAHPDDEVLGCGASIARFSREGDKVFVAILGEGITSRYDKRDEAHEEQTRLLQGNSAQVAQLLGVSELFSYSLPDNRFDTQPLLDIVKIIESLINMIRPEAVYTHHFGDLNVDHEITFRAVLTATRPLGDCPVKDLYAFEIPSSTEWGFQKLRQAFAPNVFIDVSSTIEAKIQAMGVYESERRSFPHPRSPEALRAIAQRWGSVANVGFAEAFELIRSVR
jgi:LmbE family N-acetylglucosaminyl deacetylase